MYVHCESHNEFSTDHSLDALHRLRLSMHSSFHVYECFPLRSRYVLSSLPHDFTLFKHISEVFVVRYGQNGCT